MARRLLMKGRAADANERIQPLGRPRQLTPPKKCQPVMFQRAVDAGDDLHRVARELVAPSPAHRDQRKRA